MSSVEQKGLRVGAASGVSLRGLEKSYRSASGPIHAVRGIDLRVEPGETIALLGPNGAGKSTTLDIILGLQDADRGSVEVCGLGPQIAVSRGLVGAMLQTGGLISYLSVRELVTMLSGLYPTSMDVDAVLEVAGIGDLSSRRADRLSGGQTQRVRFALALVPDPALLVLDEPTVGLDVEARQAFWETVRSCARSGKTILFATHYLEEADRHADRVVLMAHGKLVADGAPTEIKAMVAARTIRATLPDADPELLERLPGVNRADRRGDAVTLVCADSDLAIRAMLERFPDARDIEITGAGLEEAFIELTRDGAPAEAAA